MPTEYLKLIFISFIGKTQKDEYEYKLYYSETPDKVWRDDYAEQAPSTCSIEDLIPNTEDYYATIRAVSDKKINLIQDNSCFSIQDCMDGIISIAWVDNNDGTYSGLKYGSSYKDSTDFLYKIGFDFKELVEVNKDKKNEEEVVIEEEDEEEKNPFENNDPDDLDNDDLEKIYSGEF